MGDTAQQKMTAKERDALRDHLRKIVHVRKAEIDKVAAARRAEGEQELSREFKAEDELFGDLRRMAEEAAAAADSELARRCQERGIRENFRPRIQMAMSYRGENASASRRTELRTLAIARIDAMAKDAKFSIEKWELERLDELLIGVLQSSEAQTFFASLPSAETLLPPLTMSQLDALATSPSLKLVQGATGTDDEDY
ncbi:hypothetical protein B2G74_22220 [Burkholderia sp. A27]|nr:hypothetical protein B2G74_22220 [Burkholderia sp. A27]